MYSFLILLEIPLFRLLLLLVEICDEKETKPFNGLIMLSVWPVMATYQFYIYYL